MRTILIIAIAFLTLGQLNAQNSLLNFNEENILINGTPVNVGNVMLKGDIKDISKSWESFIKTHLNDKMKEDDGVLVLKETVINQITDKRGDLLTYIYNKDNEISLNVAYKLGYDVYLDSKLYPTEFDKFEEFINYFVHNYYNDYLPSYIKEKKKALKVLQKEEKKAKKSIKKSEKQNIKLNKSNSKYEKKTSKIDVQIDKYEDDEKINKLNITKSGNVKKVSENETKINYNSGLISTNETLVNSLKPQINTITNDINSAKLTLIEVRSKIKTSK
ncbi:MAG: hypothetical protein PHP52_07890 [Bacteroidales bacterium]|nr:hypothetical protein [Bacteroidales bacterium]MDD4218300.1 hypothetical protein [Bacteroidales bacterium]MDY0142560.1 hypothetical protein [Bacteroidales bacterium]